MCWTGQVRSRVLASLRPVGFTATLRCVSDDARPFEDTTLPWCGEAVAYVSRTPHRQTRKQAPDHLPWIDRVPHIPPFTPDTRLFPFESKWFESEVGPVHYVDEGVGEPILFLHGNPTWSFLYRGIIIRLRKRFRCIALDYPGFGLSAHPANYGYTPGEQASTVRSFVRELDLRNLTIMGQDWGGPIGMRVAIDELPRLRALVMSNTWYWPMDEWHMKAFSYLMSSAPMQRQILRRNFFVDQVMPRAVEHEMAPEVLRHYQEPFPTPKSRLGVAEFPRQILEAHDWLADLADGVLDHLSNVPILLPWGVNDLAFTRSFMERFREDFRLVTIERLVAKHYVQEDAPAEIATAIDAFLSEGGAAGAAQQTRRPPP